MPRITKAQDQQGFAFAANVYDHHQEDFRYLLRFKTPTEKLTQLGQDVSGKVFPPFTLASSKGQKHALKCFKMVNAWKQSIAYMAWTLQGTGYTLANAARESRSRMLGKALVDLILTRAAMRKNPEVIWCFESVQVGLLALTGHKVRLETIGSLFKLISGKGSPFTVTLGKRGEFKRATKVLIQLPVHSARTSLLAEKHQHQVDDWILEQGQWVVRVMQHEARLHETYVERRDEYTATARGLVAEVEAYLKAHSRSVPGQRLVQVDLPGIDLFDLVSSGTATPPASPTGTTILTPDSEVPKTGPDLHEEKNSSRSNVPFLHRPEDVRPADYFWIMEREWQRQHRQANGGVDVEDLSHLLVGMDL